MSRLETAMPLLFGYHPQIYDTDAVGLGGKEKGVAGGPFRLGREGETGSTLDPYIFNTGRHRPAPPPHNKSVSNLDSQLLCHFTYPPTLLHRHLPFLDPYNHIYSSL